VVRGGRKGKKKKKMDSGGGDCAGNYSILLRPTFQSVPIFSKLSEDEGGEGGEKKKKGEEEEA